MTAKVALHTWINRSSSMTRTSFLFVGIAVVCFLFADISITTLDPWGNLAGWQKACWHRTSWPSPISGS